MRPAAHLGAPSVDPRRLPRIARGRYSPADGNRSLPRPRPALTREGDRPRLIDAGRVELRPRRGTAQAPTFAEIVNSAAQLPYAKHHRWRYGTPQSSRTAGHTGEKGREARTPASPFPPVDALFLLVPQPPSINARVSDLPRGQESHGK